MESLLVFDPQNNLISAKSNQNFSEYLFDFAANNGFKFEIKDTNNNEMFRNLLSLLVTPFVVSQKYLNDVSEVEFDCILNMKAVYNKNEDFFLLYIFENSGNRLQMQRKVNIFAQIIKMICGPVIHCLTSYHNLTEIVFKMIEEWNILSESMTFMLESVERLLIGADLIKTCENILQQILSRIQIISKFTNETASHIYLFYGLKYITSISVGKSKISRGDMILMALLSNTIQKMKENDSNSSQGFIQSLNDKKKTIFESFSKRLSLNEPISENILKTNQYLVFLSSGDEHRILVPHIFRKITIEGQLFAIMLSEVPTHLSSNLITIINIINNLLNASKEKKCCHIVIQLQNCVKKLREFIIKNKLNKEKAFSSLIHHLNQLNKCQIFDYMIRSDKNLLNFQTEAQLSSLTNAIRSNYKTLVFDFFYNSLLKIQNLESNLFNEIIFFAKKTFDDYLGFFKVKSQRNVTLLGINVDIKDLIGFVYIDRTVNELIIAPIESNTCSEMTGIDTNQIIVDMIYKAYNQLMDGHLIHIWSDQHFQYSYMIWFEDSTGKELEPRVKTFYLDGFPSIIGGNFIQDIINICFSKDNRTEKRCLISESQKSSVSCYPYELFSIYNRNSILNEINAIKNTKNLSKKLWEIGISSHF